MRPAVLHSYFSEIKFIKGVGPALSKYLLRLCGDRIKDVLFHRPHAVLDRSARPKIFEALENQIATFEVEVEQHQAGYGNKSPYKILCRNETGFLNILYFGGRKDYLEKLYPVGEKVVISGQIELYGEERQISHPEFVVKPEDVSKIPKFEPIYPLTAGITQKKLLDIISQSLTKISELPEWKLSADVSFKEALRKLHHPESEEFDRDSVRRLSYDELLASQLAQALVYSKATKTAGVKIEGYLPEKLLPFELTDGQHQALDDIFADMNSGDRMFRLIQGDVGCGKTAVALCAMVAASKAGKQSIFMMPTTLLAYQQKEWIEGTAGNYGIKVEVLTGNEKGKKREEILARLKSGDIDILVGTHALFEDWVQPKDLGLVVIDEQHRFGVVQRLRLTQKNPHAHILLMTATPIPRTLTIAYYGEMDITRITEKPAERKPVDTRVMSIEKLPEITEGLKRSIDKGEKIYWICPLVEESEKSDLAAATDRFNEFKKIFGDKVALVHGKMKSDQKQQVLQDFKDGKYNLLIATTVIEVGIDVRDATIIFIEHAERFGLSQLHQLRGRVGRGDKQSTCILLYANKLGESSVARLKVMKDNHDGFKIAEEDLKLRGSGEVLGTRQSGMPSFHFAELPEHFDLLEGARQEARGIIKNDPQLTSQRGKNLKLLLSLFEYDETIEYISAG